MVDTHNISFRIPDGSGGSWSQNIPRICHYENGNFVDIKEAYVYKNGAFHLCWQKSSGPQKYYNFIMESGTAGRLRIIKGSDYPVINTLGMYVGAAGWEMSQGGVMANWVYKMAESIASTFTGTSPWDDASVWQGITGNYSIQVEYPDFTLYDGSSLPSSKDGTEIRKVTFTFTNPLSLSADKEYAIMCNRHSGSGSGQLIVYESDSSGVALTESGFPYIGNFGSRNESPSQLASWGTSAEGLYQKDTIQKVYLEINGAVI